MLCFGAGVTNTFSIPVSFTHFSLFWEKACLAKGSRLVAADFRFINVEDVKEGDLPLGPGGTPRRVSNCVSGKERLIRIVPEYRGSTPGPELDRRTLRCTDNHTIVLDQLPSVKALQYATSAAFRGVDTSARCEPTLRM